MNSQPEPANTAGDIMRDVVAGLVGAYLVTAAICLLALGADMKVVLVGSLLPALFAGPFVGILHSLRRFMADHAVESAAAWDLATVHPLPEPDRSSPTTTAA